MILAVDIGTSSFKAAIWTVDGECSAFAAVPLSFTGASHGGAVFEAGPDRWLRAFEETCLSLSAAVPLSAVEVVAISGNGPSLTPVLGRAEPDERGLRLDAAPSRLWLDRRAAAAAAEVSALAGGFVDPGFFLPKALAIKNEEPALYEKTRCFLDCPEYLACALTGEARVVFPAEGFDRWFWNRDLLERLGLDPAKFPPFINPGDCFGSLLPAVSSRFGFSPGVPVIAGGPDFFTAILGAGVTCPGQVCDRSGTSEGVNLCTEKRVMDRRLMSYGHPVKPFWNLSGIISTSGKAVEWARNLLGLGTFGELFSRAAEAAPGAGGLLFLPYLAGERAPVWDPRARGALRGLSLSSGPAECARAVFEGICFAVRDVLDVMEEAGAGAAELRIAGNARMGASERDFLNQLKADISGREVAAPEYREAELLGLAMIGARFLGRYDSYTEAAPALARIERRWEPDPRKAALYEDLFGKYRETYRALKEQ